MTFIEAAKYILEKNGNKPMPSSDIWKEISDLKLVTTTGKTPAASLNTIILGQCKDTPAKSLKHKNNLIFEIIGNNPMKFRLCNYVPSNIKESLIKNGFVTIDALKEILAKNNINIEI